MPVASTTAGRPGAAAPRAARRAAAVLRRHWLLALLLTAGLVLRVLVEVAYQPALFFIDSIKYMFGAYPGDDPPGYLLLLKPFLAVANLGAVAAVQHLLGLGMAVALYVLLLRRGSPRWLAALATAPVLLDGYQLQIEQTIMPDVLFEALMVAGLVVLLWQPRPRLWMVLVAGVLLGSTATMWQPGEILILPAVVYVAIVARGWRRTLRDAALVCAAFALPILLVSFRNYVDIHRFSLAPNAAATIYGRMAAAADCQTLRVPSYERQLCPSPQLAARLGPDGLDHNADSPLKNYVPPAGMAQHGVATDFSRRVLTQQPLRVAGAILGDAAKLFEVHRVSSPGDTWIGRWQFQTHFPTYPPYVQVGDGQVGFYELDDSGLPVLLGTGQQFSSGGPVVVKPLAVFLRDYQLNGGYTPGPLYLFSLLAGLAGSAFLLRRARNMTAADRDTARACCYLLASGVAVLLLSDTFEFSWRYQLPALMTLPPAGALGITVIIGYVRSLRRPRPAEGRPVTPAGTAAAAVTGTAGGRGPAAGTGTAGGRAAAAGAGAADGDDPARRPDAAEPEPQDSDRASAVDS
jgi:Dolichyl-phosphate-mannose-protein mannosyltransferase